MVILVNLGMATLGIVCIVATGIHTSNIIRSDLFYLESKALYPKCRTSISTMTHLTSEFITKSWEQFNRQSLNHITRFIAAASLSFGTTRIKTESFTLTRSSVCKKREINIKKDQILMWVSSRRNVGTRAETIPWQKVSRRLLAFISALCPSLTCPTLPACPPARDYVRLIY